VHTAYEANRLFEDTQLEGPFRAWRHRHEFHDLGQGRTRLVDRILFSLPGGPLADLLAGWLAKNQLARMFRYRHEVTRRCCEQHADNPAGGYSAGA
jgi:ligand-binding SRPBCC domain-containing protein